MQKDYFFEDLKNQYSEAYFSFQTGRRTIREFSEIVLEIYIKILGTYETLQPYISNLEKGAEENWNKAVSSSKNFIGKKKEFSIEGEYNSIVKDLGERFLVADLNFRKGALSIPAFNKTIAEILINLLDRTNQIQPYFNEFQKAAEKQWSELQ